MIDEDFEVGITVRSEVADVDIVKIEVKSQVEAESVVSFAFFVFVGVLVVADARA